MSPLVVATAFEKDAPYDYWIQHACGESFDLLDQATTNLDGSPRPNYTERMRACPRCWAETNTVDALLSPGVGQPFPAEARGTNCLELGHDEAVPEWLWRKFEGERMLLVPAPARPVTPTRSSHATNTSPDTLSPGALPSFLAPIAHSNASSSTRHAAHTRSSLLLTRRESTSSPSGSQRRFTPKYS
jgi:hypothetical protein